MTVLTFPSNPIEGQVYDAPNGIRYVYDGVKWVVETVTSTSEAVTNSVQDRVAPMFVDGDNSGITFTYDAVTNTISASVTSVNGDSLINGIHSFTLETDGSLTAPYGKLGVTPQEEFGISADVDTAAVIRSNDGAHKWTFATDGALTTPNGGRIASAGMGWLGIDNGATGTPISINNYVGGELGTIATSVFLTSDYVNITASTNTWAFGTDGNLALPAGGDIVDSNGSSVLGGGANTGNITFDGNTISNAAGNNIEVTTTTTNNDLNIVKVGQTEVDLFAYNEVSHNYSELWLQNPTGGPSLAQIIVATNNVTKEWNFQADGTLILPNSGAIKQDYSFTKTTAHNIALGTSDVVWSGSFDYISSAKLTIQVECNEDGDASGWHSQACEAIIASRGYASSYGGPGGDPQMTVYGVVHTSIAPLVTFTVQRNPTTKLIEVVGTTTAAAGGTANLRIHSVEMATND